MEAMQMCKLAIKELFLVDWSAPTGTTSFTDKGGRVILNRSVVQAGIADDPLLGRCTSSNGYGGWLQSNAQYPIDLRVNNWTLTIDTIVAQVGVSQTLISQAIAASGGGGWYIALTANAGRFDLYWKDAGNVWRVISTSMAIPIGVKVTVKVVRNGTSLSLYLNDTLAASANSNVSFNNAAIPIAIGQWSDGLTNTWYGKIGKIRFANE